MTENQISKIVVDTAVEIHLKLTESRFPRSIYSNMATSVSWNILILLKVERTEYINSRSKGMAVQSPDPYTHISPEGTTIDSPGRESWEKD